MFLQKKSFPDSHPELPVDPDVLQPRNLKRPPHLTAEFQVIVFLGGCLGTLARYGIMLRLPASTGTWPAATLSVNMVGAFLLGFLLEALARRGNDTGVRRLLRLAFGTGFMGAFTTYSSFAVEANLLVKHGNMTLAAIYILVSLIGGILVCTCGIWLASMGSARRRRAA